MKVYGYFRSGSSRRLRIALNLKGLTYEYIPVNLRGEEHLSARYKALNPQGLVPTLETDGHVFIQSPAPVTLTRSSKVPSWANYLFSSQPRSSF